MNKVIPALPTAPTGLEEYVITYPDTEAQQRLTHIFGTHYVKTLDNPLGTLVKNH